MSSRVTVTVVNKEESAGKSAKEMADLAATLKKLTTSFKEKSKIVTDVQEKFDGAKAELDKAVKAADVVQTKIDAIQLKLGSFDLAKAGITFVVVAENKVIAKAKDLDTAMKTKVKASVVDAGIFAVNKAKKRSKVMVWGVKDPITNRRFKGPSWFFLTEALLKKYGTPATKRWLDTRNKAREAGTLNPFAKKK